MINDTCRASLVAGEITSTTTATKEERTITRSLRKRVIGRTRQVVEFNESKACQGLGELCLEKYASVTPEEESNPRRRFQKQVLAKNVLVKKQKSIFFDSLRLKRRKTLALPACIFSLPAYISLLLLSSDLATVKCSSELNQNQLLHPIIDHETQKPLELKQPVIAASFVASDNSTFAADTIRGAAKRGATNDLHRDQLAEWRKDSYQNYNLRRLSERYSATLDVQSVAPAIGSSSSSSSNGILSRRARSQVSPSSLAGAPKLVQWAKEAVQYYEGSTLVLSCSLAMSIAQGNPLKFTWFKQGKQLSSSSTSNSNNNNNNNPFSNRLSTETLADYSFLRLADLRSSDSGAYTCVATNSFGQEDRTSTQVIVNVKLKWLAPSSPVDEKRLYNISSIVGNGNELLTIKAGQFVSFECNAAAQPQPRIRWFKLGSPMSQSIEGTGKGRLNRLHGNEVYGSGQIATSLAIQRNEGGGGGGKGDKLQSNQFAKLDEAQIRSSLLQMDAIPNLAELLNRFEITSSSGSQSKEVSSGNNNKINSNNETKGWRIETMISGGGAGAQHELFSRLVLDKADVNHNGIYECEVIAAEQSIRQQQEQVVANSQITGDRLQKFFGLVINVSTLRSNVRPTLNPLTL